MKKKKITGSDVGIIFSIVGIIASMIVIFIDVFKGESPGVGIGLIAFCLITLATNIKNKTNNKQ